MTMQEARDILELKCVFSYAPAHKSDAADQFCVDESDITISPFAAPAHKISQMPGAK